MRILEYPLKIVRAFLAFTSASPDVSKADEARLCYDASADALSVSTNGGAYAPLMNATTPKIGGTALTTTAAQLNQITAAFGTVTFSRAVKVAKIALAGAVATTGGAVGAWQNPEAGAILITSVLADVTTKSTGAANLDIGTATASAATSSDNLIDGVDASTAAGLFDNIAEAGTNGKSRQKLAAGKWVTVTGDASTAGLVGSVYVFYVTI